MMVLLSATYDQKLEDLTADRQLHFCVAVAVIDIWMPGVSGLEIRGELQAISPKTSLKNLLWPDCNGVESLAAPRGASGLKALQAAALQVSGK